MPVATLGWNLNFESCFFNFVHIKVPHVILHRTKYLMPKITAIQRLVANTFKFIILVRILTNSRSLGNEFDTLNKFRTTHIITM